MTPLAFVGWLLAALFGALWYAEHDRRLHAEGARHHAFTATVLRPDPGSDAELEKRIEESEARAATEAFLAMAKREGRAVDPDEAAAHVRELLARAGGVG